MSGSEELQSALVSVDNHSTIMELLDVQRDTIGFDELRDVDARTQEVLT
jgi:hypothetical protein